MSYGGDIIIKIYYLKNEFGKIVYVGQTRRNLKVRLDEHKRRYKNRENYTIHLITEVETIKEADELETYYINKFDTVKNGENITYGKGRKGLGDNNTSFKKGNNFSNPIKKKVKCIETGKIYNSIIECAKDLNLRANNISEVCNGRRKSTGKKHFVFVE